MNDTSNPIEKALKIGLRRLIQWALPLSIGPLIFGAPTNPDDLLVYSMIHLGVLQIATLLLAVELAPLLRQPWFADTNRSWLVSAASLIAVATGFAGLLTLASAAAARYDVSLQFLQLLSSLDIAWVTSAIFYGTLALWNRRVAWVSGGLIITACVASIVVYLDVVGFTNQGGWLVNGSKMMTIVIPADMVAAIIAVSLILTASNRRDQLTAQPKPQS